MLIQRLYKNGNSVAVTIPKEILEELKLKEGAEVVIKKRGSEVIVSSKQSALAPDITPKFMKALDNFVQRHHDVLAALAKK